MKTGILRDDVTVQEFVYQYGDRDTSMGSLRCYERDASQGKRLGMDGRTYPESWYTDIKEDHKPCPRCGGEGEEVKSTTFSQKARPAIRLYIQCRRCGMRTDDHLMPGTHWQDWDQDYD